MIKMLIIAALSFNGCGVIATDKDGNSFPVYDYYGREITKTGDLKYLEDFYGVKMSFTNNCKGE